MPLIPGAALAQEQHHALRRGRRPVSEYLSRRAHRRRRRCLHGADVHRQSLHLPLWPARRGRSRRRPEKGVFVLENGFDLDTGKVNQGSRLFGRQAFVGLPRDPYGTLTLGRHQTLLFDFSSAFDPVVISTRYSLLMRDKWMSGRAATAPNQVHGHHGRHLLRPALQHRI
ncbi:porin [Cupriavidus basilensis]